MTNDPAHKKAGSPNEGISHARPMLRVRLRSTQWLEDISGVAKEIKRRSLRLSVPSKLAPGVALQLVVELPGGQGAVVLAGLVIRTESADGAWNDVLVAVDRSRTAPEMVATYLGLVKERNGPATEPVRSDVEADMYLEGESLEEVVTVDLDGDVEIERDGDLELEGIGIEVEEEPKDIPTAVDGSADFLFEQEPNVPFLEDTEPSLVSESPSVVGWGAAAFTAAPVLSPGKLGRYELLAPIGSGGMAYIYLGRISGPGGFRKPVAVKVIHQHLAEDPQFIRMFMDEATIASHLQHQNIVQVFELGEYGGVFYIAMELLQGETVKSMVDRVIGTGGTLTPALACYITMLAAEGLHHAHEQKGLDGRSLNLVHRDVTPQNIFVTYAGGVKVLDFGIALAAGRTYSTQPGSLKGKFSYMSPEQVRGYVVDRRSDVFALGINLWEMLVGRPLFLGNNDVQTLHKVDAARVPRVSEFRNDVPAILDQVVATALAREPEERYATAMELQDDLSAVIDGLGQRVRSRDVALAMEGWFPAEKLQKQVFMSRVMKDKPKG